MLDAFARDGAVALRGLLDDRWITNLRSAIPELLERAEDPGRRLRGAAETTAQTLQADGMWIDSETFRAFLFESPIGAAAADLMRSHTARLYEDLLLHGAAGAAGTPSWHQDSPSWPLMGAQLSSVWFTLEPVTAETGALRVVAGSHRGPMYVPWFSADHASAHDLELWTGGPFPDIDADPARFPVLTFATEPGDVVVVHPQVIHTAIGSSPLHPRRTFTIRFMGDDVRWLPRHRVFHRWMNDCGFAQGDVLDHPRFPVVWPAPADARTVP